MHGLLPEESRRTLADGGHQLRGQRAQEGQHRRADEQRQGGGQGNVVLHTVKFRLTGGVLFPEQADIQLGHVGHGQSAADEEENLHKAVRASRRAMGLQVVDQLQDALMQQALADIPAADGRDAPDGQRSQQEGDVQHGLLPAKAADVVQVQLVQVHEHHTRRHEQYQLDEGMIDHVHDRAIGGQGALLAQQHHHGQAYGDEADLAHGGAGQRALEVHGEQRQQRAQEHGDHRQHQQRVAEGHVPGHQIGADDNQPEHAALGQDAGEQRAGRGGGHGVGLGQPDVQREHARLGGKAHQRQPHGHGEGAAFALGHGGLQPGEGQRARFVPEQEQSHQRGQAADHGHRQVGSGSLHGAGGFLLGHPYIAGQGHDFKENQGGIQVVGKEHAQGGAQGHEVEEIVAVAVVVVGEIFPRENARHHPHEGRDAGVQAAEAVCPEVQPQAAEALHRAAAFTPKGHQAADKGRGPRQRHQKVPGFLRPAADNVAYGGHHHGAKGKHR